MTNEILIWIFHLKNLSFIGAECYNIALSQIRIVPLHVHSSISKEKGIITIIHLYFSVGQISSRQQTLIRGKVIIKMIYNSSANGYINIFCVCESLYFNKNPNLGSKLNTPSTDSNLLLPNNFEFSN